MKPTAAQIRALAAEGCTKAQAARRVGMDRSHFGKLVKALAPDAVWVTQSALKADVLDRLRVCADKGMTRTDAARLVGRSPKHVSHLAKVHGIRLKGSIHSLHFTGHLTPQQREDYRLFRAARFSADEALAMVEQRP